MAWLYLPDMADSKSDCPSGSAPSATSKITVIQQGFSGHGFGAGTSPMRQSGMTSPPSTGLPGLDRWILSRAGSRVRISARRDAVQAWKASAALFFSRSCGWPMKRGPRSYSLRTSPGSEHADSDELGENWPLTAMIVDGVLYPLRKWERRKGGTDGGVWPTPTVTGNGNRAAYGGKSGDGLETVAKRLWPAPTAQGSAGEISEDLVRRGKKLVNKKTGRVLQTNLATEAKLWPAITVAAAIQGENIPDGKRGETLISAARRSHWGTLLSSDHQSGNAGMSRGGASSPVRAQARKWATIMASDGAKGGPGQKYGAGNPKLPAMAATWQASLLFPGLLAPTILTGGDPTAPPIWVLSPWFGEALMGLPVGWTELSPSEMEWFLSRRGKDSRPFSSGMKSEGNQVELFGG